MENPCRKGFRADGNPVRQRFPAKMGFPVKSFMRKARKDMYQVSEKSRQRFDAMCALEEVKKALAFIQEDERRTLDEQKELVLIEAPTGQEEERAKVFADKFRALGLTDVHIDRGGNVIGVRPGTGNGPRVLIEGHLDTVFPFGTVHGVEERDGFLYAPGIGDDTRALAMLLCVIRAVNHVNLKNVGDIVFVGTSREEGMGGLGGMKDFLNDNTDIDISLSLDNNDMSDIVYQATGGEAYGVNFHGIGGHAFGAFGKMAQPVHAAARAVAKIAAFTVPEDPKTSFCVSNFHAGNDAGVHAIASDATIKFNFRSDSQEELARLRDKIFQAIEESCKEETEKWGCDTITWDKTIISEIPGGNQDPHAPLVEAAYLGLDYLDVGPRFRASGCTNANVAIAKKIPAICMGRAYAPDENSKNILNHSIHEKFPMAGSYKAVQQAFMMLVTACGIEGKLSPLVDKQ